MRHLDPGLQTAQKLLVPVHVAYGPAGHQARPAGGPEASACLVRVACVINDHRARHQAQEIILMYEFNIAKDKPTSDYYSEYSKEKLDDNFNPVGE